MVESQYYTSQIRGNIVVTNNLWALILFVNEKGEKVGCINVHMFRPWSEKHFLAALPKTVKKIAVLERTKETGANGEPMYHSVAASFARADIRPKIYNGRYGIAS